MEGLPFNFCTVKHYAEAVGKHPRTIRRWCAEGRLKWRRDRGGRGIIILVKDLRDFGRKSREV